MREEKEKKKREGGFQAGGVGIVMKSGCVKNKNKREDKDVLSHGEHQATHMPVLFAGSIFLIYFLIQKDCQ